MNVYFVKLIINSTNKKKINFFHILYVQFFFDKTIYEITLYLHLFIIKPHHAIYLFIFFFVIFFIMTNNLIFF